MFVALKDNQGTYFIWQPGSGVGLNLADLPAAGRGTASFLAEDLEAIQKVDNVFTNDLTARDDVLLAVMSLVLLLVIQGIVTTILLRTRDGQVSTFSFAVKQVVELAREFRIKRIWEGPKGIDGLDTRSKRSKVDLRLVIIAVIVVLGTFGLEVLVLFLTERESRDVSNRKVSLEVAYPWKPEWQPVRFHNRASVNRPCMALSLTAVDQGKTRISTCMTTTFGTDSFKPFEKATEEKRVTIITHVHQYGMEHAVQIGGDLANYSGRAYFNLDDEKLRIMVRRSPIALVREKVEVLHRQYLALLFNIYNLEIEDKDMNLERLQAIAITTKETLGEEIPIIIKTVGNNSEIAHTSKSRKFYSQFNGTVPFGKAALRFAQPVFKGAMAVQVHEWNMTDLFAEGTVREEFGVVWKEPIRIINWLSLTIILAVAMLVLGLLRFFLKPVATAEIAGLFVKEAVGATWDRSPLQMDENEKQSFRLHYSQRGSVSNLPVEQSRDALSSSFLAVPMQNVASTPDEVGVQNSGEVFGLRSTNDDYIFRSTGISYNRRKMAQDSADESLELS